MPRRRSFSPTLMIDADAIKAISVKGTDRAEVYLEGGAVMSLDGTDAREIAGLAKFFFDRQSKKDRPTRGRSSSSK